MTCQDATGLVSESMDRPLPWGAWVLLRAHCLNCAWCTRYRQQLLFIRNVMRRCPDRLMGQESSAGLSPEESERLRLALRHRRDK